MEYQLEKEKETLVISPIQIAFEDSYSKVHIRPYYIEKFGIPQTCFRNKLVIDKKIRPMAFEKLSLLILDINLFKPRDEVPNKKVTYEVSGTSVLHRSKDKTKIEISYRRGKTLSVTSNNTCYITNDVRERFFHDSKLAGCPEVDKRGNHHYYLTVADNSLFWKWSDYMDEEYIKLAGEKYRKHIRPKPFNYREEDHCKEYDKALEAYAYAEIDDFEIFYALAEKGYCKINDKKTSLYDRYGYWICEFDEFAGKDRNAFMLKSILRYLDKLELTTVKNIIDKLW